MSLRAVVSAALVACLFVSPAPAQVDEALKAVPSDAVGLVIINQVSDVNAKLKTLATKIGAPPMDALDLVKSQLAIEKGLNEKGTVVGAFFADKDKPQDDAGLLLFIPVSDYEDFIGQFEPKKAKGKIREITIAGEKSLVVQKGTFAVIAEGKKRSRKYLNNVLEATQSIADEVKPLRTWLGNNDFSMVITTNGIRTLAKAMREGIKEGKEELQPTGNPELDKLQKMMMRWVDDLDAFLKTPEKEITHVAAGAKLNAKTSDLILDAKVFFAEGGNLAKFAGELKVPEGGLFAGVPGGDFVFAGGAYIPGKTYGLFADWMVGLLKGIDDKEVQEAVKALEAAKPLMTDLRSSSFVWGVNKPDTPIFSNTFGVATTTDAEKYLDNYAKSLEQLNKLAKESEGPEYQFSRAKVAGKPALVVVMDLSDTFNVVPDPNFKRIIEALVGKGGKMTATIVAVNKTNIVFGYVTPKEMEKHLKAGKGEFSQDAQVAKTDALLPKGSQLAVYVSPAGLAKFSTAIVKQFMPLDFPDFPKSPPLAWTVKVSRTGCETRFVLPGETMTAIGVYIGKLQAKFGGANIN
ncbi:MAG: hypothetical protein KatS3mg105_0783 [Gemmatales bacterium]|nr:MAG: hypothetical protein KatS3mg105_0783 [Gemmatales bacterium]